MYYERQVGDKLVEQIAWSSCVTLLPLAVLLMLVFFLNIKKEYRKTFWSLKRGKDVTMGHFTDRTDDATKSLVFLKNYRHWREIEDEVKDWVLDNWNTWVIDQPEWFNDNIKSRIPPRMVPVLDDQKTLQRFQNNVKRNSMVLNRLPSISRLLSSSSSNSSGARVSSVAPDTIVNRRDTLRMVQDD